MAWQVDDEALAEHVRRIISTIDLASCTKKDIMALLEGAVLGGGAGGAATPAALASALADKKDFISKTIDDVLMARIVSEEDERLARQLQQEETTPLTRSRSGSKASPRAPRKRRAAKGAAPLQLPTGMTLIASGFNRPLKLSKALAALFGGTVTHLSRPQVVKRIWQYVKENGLQDESNRRIIICDELLKAVFRAGRVDCFQMNKVLSSHLFPDKNYDPTATDAPIDSAEEEEGAPALDKSSSLVNDDDDSFGNDAERPAAPKIGRASRPLAEGEASSSPQPAPFTIPRQLSRIIPAVASCAASA